MWRTGVVDVVTEKKKKEKNEHFLQTNLTHQSNCVQVWQSSASNMLKEDSLGFQFGMETLFIFSMNLYLF